MGTLQGIALLLGALAAGYGIGRLTRVGRKHPRALAGVQNLCVWALIFAMGMRLGADGRVLGALVTLGGQALAITAFAMAGSIAAAVLAARILDKKDTRP